MTKNLLFVGVGGQGILLVSQVLGCTLMHQGYDFKSFEIHGMSQRGGPVAVHVRFGDHVCTPIIGQGEVDILIAFEQLEGLRYISYLKQDGIVISSTQQLSISSFEMNRRTYPSDCICTIKNKGINIYAVDNVKIAEQCGSEKVSNMILLGMLAHKLQLPKTVFNQAIDLYIKNNYLEMSQEAFLKGYQL